MLLPTAMTMVTEAIPYLYPDTTDIFLRTTVREILFDGLVIHCSDPEVGKHLSLTLKHLQIFF